MENLITLEDYKLYKGMTKTDEDSRLEMIITNVSSIIQAYLGRTFSETGNDITEVISLDYDTPVLFLDKYPVTELVSITELDPYGYDSTVHFPVPATNFYLDSDQGKLFRVGGGYWPQGPGAVVVTYRAGYPGGIVAIPADLRQAALDLVTYYHKEEYKPSMQTRGASITNAVSTGGRGVDPSTKFPPHIQRILDLYK